MNEALENLSQEAKDSLKKASMPKWVEPMLATLTHEHFSDEDWIYERKLDGQRCLVFKEGEDVRIMSRNEKEQNSFFPEAVEAFQKLSGDFILDAECVVFDDNVTSFSKLQNRMHVQNPEDDLLKKYPVHTYVFDILHLDGYDLTKLELQERKSILKNAFTYEDPLSYLPHRNEEGKKYLEEACERGWEGLIAKEAASTYVHSRSKKWLKFKCAKGQEFVIGGYTEPQGERKGFGALLIGYYEGDKLCYAGGVGTGYDDDFLKEFHEKMQRYVRKTRPFENYEDNEENVTWLTPHFVAEIGFTEWTGGGKLRHPRFLGLRKDKAPEDVVQEDKHAG